jgi:hypothetical protein
MAKPSLRPSKALHHEDAAHDKSTDSLTVEVRRLPSVRVPAQAGIDIGEDGEPVGYDIEHASTKKVRA